MKHFLSTFISVAKSMRCDQNKWAGQNYIYTNHLKTAIILVIFIFYLVAANADIICNSPSTAEWHGRSRLWC
jgi:hypothetical protein